MPLRGIGHSSHVQDEHPYFETLAAFDDYMDQPSEQLSGAVPFPEQSDAPSIHQGKLLVCHDYKGGYTERPDKLAYTFNFWSICDTFIYFSHQRVTIPPSGWTNIGHRQGTKVLGTLIFEHQSGEEDCLRLLLGRLPPNTVSGPAVPRNAAAWSHFSVSPHYARRLAILARQRGFDGYLLNVEVRLRGGPEQVRALVAWIDILRAEMRKHVGPHSEVIWYDSTVITGQLAWQDRLNAYNVPFFMPSTGFFTNYTWPAHYPSLTAQYFLSLITSQNTTQKIKTLHDVFVGVDIWGRGSHGGGGLGAFRALEHIDPLGLGLSGAVFGPAWSWETIEGQPGWTWHTWWARERTFWLGNADKSLNDAVELPEFKRRQGEPECTHGVFRPIAEFFEPRPAPDPRIVPLNTTFSPGVGWAWCVQGKKVLDAPGGWTDVDKQTSLGNLAWPAPAITWEDEQRTITLPNAETSLCVDDAWMGGSSLQLKVTADGISEEHTEEAFFRCIWIPVQSFSVTPGCKYMAVLVYKLQNDGPQDIDVGLSVKHHEQDDTNTHVELSNTADARDLPHGWTQLTINFNVTQEDVESPRVAAAGLVLGIAAEDPTQTFSADLFLGQLTVFPAHDEPPLKVLWAHFTPPEPGSAELVGLLTWDAGIAFPALQQFALPDSESPTPVFVPPTNGATPTLAYCNVYAEVEAENGSVGGPEASSFIGTSGLDGHSSKLRIEECMLTEELKQAKAVRFYVQGITQRGEPLPWERCAYVDWKKGSANGGISGGTYNPGYVS